MLKEPFEIYLQTTVAEILMSPTGADFTSHLIADFINIFRVGLCH